MTVEDLPWWGEGMAALSDLHRQHGADAERRALEHGRVYEGRRGVMVFDVVASRQRRYTQRVLPMVQRYEAAALAPDLASLAEHGAGEGHGLRSGEGQTMQAVASGLLRYAARHGLGEEEGVKQWATSAATFEHASKLEPFVGHVSGMGPALLAYLRMRCGADALKPDLRVRDGLNALGFQVPADEHSILVVAHAAAAALGIRLIVLDQLLWWLNEGATAPDGSGV